MYYVNNAKSIIICSLQLVRLRDQHPLRHTET